VPEGRQNTIKWQRSVPFRQQDWGWTFLFQILRCQKGPPEGTGELAEPLSETSESNGEGWVLFGKENPTIYSCSGGSPNHKVPGAQRQGPPHPQPTVPLPALSAPGSALPCSQSHPWTLIPQLSTGRKGPGRNQRMEP
jgi:hypothetical protein